MTAKDKDLSRCLNCQTDLTGPFCGQCGQARSARLVPVNDWLGDFFGTFFKLDSKLLRTIKKILLQPGQATLDFAAGHRIPYSGPAKVYIIVSAISIAAMTLLGFFSAKMEIPGWEDAEGLQKKIQFLFPLVNLLSPIVTAGILAVFQRGLFFQLHLAFSLHVWSFFVVVTTPLIFIPPTSIWSLVAFGGFCVVTSVYLLLAHRKVYTMPLLNRLGICGIVVMSVPVASLAIFFLLFVLAALLP